MLFLDFETRSKIDLKQVGSFAYATHPSTEVLCASYAIGEKGDVHLWKRGDSLGFFSSYMGDVCFHNYGFDSYIWEFVWKLPRLSPERVSCSMSMALAQSLPASLEGAAEALGLQFKKDMAGSRAMKALCKPRASGEFYTEEEAPERYAKLHEYALSDIRAQRELYYKLRKITGEERKIFELDQVINRRGIPVDTASVNRAIELIENEQKTLISSIREITQNTVSTPNAVAQMRSWLSSQGVETEGLTKGHIETLLALDLTADVRRVLEIRQEFSKASVAKLLKMRDSAVEGRIRGTMQYHGASTGRWSGKLIQPQNFVRGKVNEDYFTALEQGLSIPKPIEATSINLRGFIKAPPNHRFIGADYSQIEARVLPWLAGEKKVLKVFESGRDIYKAAAAAIYKVEEDQVTSDQRFVGKVATLALGYAGGKRAFANMAKNYGVDISEEEAEAIKVAWRKANPKIVKYWAILEEKAIEAVLTPGVNVEIPFGMMRKQGNFLWIRLPSGRCLCYPFPEVREVTTPWGSKKDAVTFMSVNSLTRKWERTITHGGVFCENGVQATARDIMSHAMLNVEKCGYPLILTVHDELITEVPSNFGSVAELTSIMCQLPEWAKGLPIKAEGWEGFRYCK